MLHNLKPYSKYKDSGVPWLGKVPEHWQMRRLKHISTLHGRIGFHGLSSSDYGSDGIIVVSGSNFRDWHVDWNQCHRISEGWYEKDKNIQLRNGDLLVTKDGTIGKTAIVNELTEKAVLNSGVIVVRPKKPIQYESRYLLYLINSKVFDAFIDIKKTGATIHHLYEATFSNFSISLPPLSEQSAIVHYLDHFDWRIRHYIRAKKKLIKLLEEQKQAIIHQAVTRGLDPNVKLKPSGVEWLGDVPEHWEVTVAKRVCDIFIPQRDKPELNDIEGIPWVTLENIGNTYVENVRFFVKDTDAKVAGSRVLPSGSIIASCVGRFGIVSITTEPVIINQQIQAYIPKGDVSPMFFRYCVQVSKTYFEMQGNSTTLAYVDREAFSNMPLLLPSISEQNAIVEMLNAKIGRLEQAVKQLQREISLLREYRTRLIADVVTGKLDVREAAANLPEETDEIETSDDALDEDEELENNEIENEQAGELEEEVIA